MSIITFIRSYRWHRQWRRVYTVRQALRFAFDEARRGLPF